MDECHWCNVHTGADAGVAHEGYIWVAQRRQLLGGDQGDFLPLLPHYLHRATKWIIRVTPYLSAVCIYASTVMKSYVALNL